MVTSRTSVSYDVHGATAVISIAEPQSRNALSPSVFRGLLCAIDSAVEDGVRSLVLTGEGRTFCAGGDLTAVNDALSGDVDSALGDMVDDLHSIIRALRAVPFPTVAAVNGAAVGAGIALALACDVRVLARSAAFITGYLAVGATPDGGASFHLARALGTSQAVASFLLNKRIGSEELLRIGLADDVVDDGDALDVGTALADKLCELSPDAVTATRELVDGATTRSLSDHLDAERSAFLKVARTEGFRNGVAPFAR